MLQGPTGSETGANVRDEDVQVRVVYRERWTRTLVLTGKAEAVIRYNAMGHGEQVHLDGKLWARTSAWCWQVVYPWSEFPLPGRSGNLRARIDVAASMM